MTNHKVVLDSNVFCKLFLDEPDRQQAVELVTELNARDCKIIAPDLFLYEVLSVAALSDFSTLRTYELIKQQQKVNLRLVAMDDNMVKKAIAITERGHANSGYPSFYDSAFHALAILNKCRFVTADSRHEAKTRELGYITLLKDWKSLF